MAHKFVHVTLPNITLPLTKKAVTGLTNRDILVGWFPASVTVQQPLRGNRLKKGGQSIAAIAYYNNYGTSKGVPKRDFMEKTISDNQERLAVLMNKLAMNVFMNRQNTASATSTLGMHFARMLKRTIKSNMPPPNSPRTIARKQSNRTLIDSGQMLRAVTWKVLNRAAGQTIENKITPTRYEKSSWQE